MEPDVPQSPFAPGFSPSAEPEQPRLGIVHFLVWTACVAVYLAIARMMWSEQSSSDASVIIRSLHGVPAGASLGGLLLWASRRMRGWTFPRYPGEYLLVVGGLGVAIYLAGWVPIWTVYFKDRVGLSHQVYVLLLFGMGVLNASFLVWAAVRIKVRRWRWFFLGLVATAVSFAPVLRWGAFVSTEFTYAIRLALDVWLLVVVLRDHFLGFRFPWTHWLAVAIRWTTTAVMLAGAAWRMLAGNGAF